MTGHVLALSGGVGGARLVHGLSMAVAPQELVVVANTGDDFVHLGLSVSPDVDTLVYTLAGLADPERGWGRRDETWRFLSALEALGGPTWFGFGDADLAMHVERSRRLAAGESLSDVTATLARRLGVAARIVPMSDDAVRTRLRTGEGWLDFQDYFVRQRCAPVVRELAYEGAQVARPARALLESLADPGLRAVVVCPSNPLLSIEPILALPGVRAAIAECAAPVVAVSPLIAGRAVKGPTAKMMRELGIAVSAAGVAQRYAGLIDAIVVDADDVDEVRARSGAEAFAADILMRDVGQREALARLVLDLADRVAAIPADRRKAARAASAGASRDGGSAR